METVIRPTYKVLYNQKDVTSDLSERLLSLTYNDKIEGESDEIDLRVEDKDGLWRTTWYPDKGDKLTVSIGYNNDLVSCGLFEIDDITISSPPDTIAIRGLAVPIKASLRTLRSFAFEDLTLKQIAQKVAARHSLTLIESTGKVINLTSFRMKKFESEYNTLTSFYTASSTALKTGKKTDQDSAVRYGDATLGGVASSLAAGGEAALGKRVTADINQIVKLHSQNKFSQASSYISDIKSVADSLKKKYGESTQTSTTVGVLDRIRFERITQNRETDLKFLNRISEAFGYIFSIRNDKLVFINITELEKLPVSLSIDRLDMLSYNIRDKASQVYASANVRYHKPKEKKTITANVEASEDDLTGTEGYESSDVLEVRGKAEDPYQAELMAKAALHKNNIEKVTGGITLQGNPYLVAGINIELTGIGKASGIYHVVQSTHSIDNGSGYTTSADIRRVKLGDISKQVPQKNSTNAIAVIR